MCGIVGIAGSIDKHDMPVFHQLLWVGAIRGTDNTGVMSVGKHMRKDIRMVKTSGDPAILMDRKEYGKVVTENTCLLLGHNRSKTKGDSNHKNAHPFEFENIVGVHNGTVTYGTQNKFEGRHPMFQTDSEALFYRMNEDGVDKVIEMMDPGATPPDAYSLVWYNKKDATLNFLRNKERPMFFCYNEAGNTMYWASELAMLYLCLNRNFIKFNKVWTTLENTHYKWTIPEFDKEIEKPEKRVLKETPRPLAKSSMTSRSGSGHDQRHFGRTNGFRDRVTGQFNNQRAQYEVWDPDTKCYVARDLLGNLGKAPPAIALPPPKPVEHDPAPGDDRWWDRMSYMMVPKDTKLPGYYVGKSQVDILYEQDFAVRMACGCSNCQANPAWGEPVRFMRDGTFVCFDCMQNDKDDIRAVVALL